MSLIIAIKGTDGIVLASDSRAINVASGTYTDNKKKIYQINNHVAVGLAGEEDYILPAIRKVQEDYKSDQFGVTEIAKNLLEAICKRVNEWTNRLALNYVAATLNQREDPCFEIIIAGYDSENEKKQPRIYYYNLGQFAPFEPHDTPYCCAGIKADATRYLCSTYLELKSLDEVTQIVKDVIKQTAQSFIGVGGATQILQIKENGTIKATR